MELKSNISDKFVYHLKFVDFVERLGQEIVW